MLFHGKYNEAARAWIAWLLTATPSQLGYAPFVVTIGGASHQLNTFIGHGMFSYAYELPGTLPVVVKYFPDVAKADNERAIYRAIGPCDTTTQLVEGKQPAEPQFIVISPRGYAFDATDRRLTAQHVDQLVAAVRYLHAQGVVHKDICASNILWVDRNTAVLNDWSHARHAGAGTAADPGERLRDIVRMQTACYDAILHTKDRPLESRLFDVYCAARRAVLPTGVGQHHGRADDNDDDDGGDLGGPAPPPRMKWWWQWW